MFGISTQELLIVAAILFMLFGATRLPTLMRSLGRSVNEFKTGLREEPKRLDDNEEPVDSKRLEEKEKEKEKVS